MTEEKFGTFKTLHQRLDALIANSNKEQLAECARLLALNVARYKSKYRELPLEEHHQMAIATDVDEGLAQLLASGMLEMLTTLALVTRATYRNSRASVTHYTRGPTILD